jgi:hypothetical protein
MAWKLLTSKTVKISRKLACEYAEMEPAPHDRVLSERRMQVYEKLARSGQFRPCVWAKVDCDETKGTYRVNGKHTANLYARACDDLPENMATIEHYECSSLEDVGRLYGTFDSGMQTRSSSDINRAFAATIPELAALPRKIIDCSASGIALYKCGGTQNIANKFTPPERAEFLIEYPEFVLWTHRIIGDTSKFRHILRMGVFGGMFGCWSKAKGDAESFWTAVCEESGEKPTCPDRQLARWLLLTSVKSNSVGDIPNKRRADSREMYVRCTVCWNAWRRGEDLKIIKYHAAAKAPSFT